MTANERPLTDDAVAEITRRLEAIHGFEHKHYEDNMFGRDTLAELDAHGRWIAWDMRTPYSTAACEFIVSAPADIRALIAAYEALLAENARLREALRELFELHTTPLDQVDWVRGDEIIGVVQGLVKQAVHQPAKETHDDER